MKRLLDALSNEPPLVKYHGAVLAEITLRKRRQCRQCGSAASSSKSENARGFRSSRMVVNAFSATCVTATRTSSAATSSNEPRAAAPAGAWCGAGGRNLEVRMNRDDVYDAHPPSDFATSLRAFRHSACGRLLTVDAAAPFLRVGETQQRDIFRRVCRCDRNGYA